MLGSFAHKTGSPRRTVRLGVETLEGRDMPSTLPVLAYQAPQAVWPPPPPTVQVCLLPSTGAHDVVPFDHRDPIGEEIPQ